VQKVYTTIQDGAKVPKMAVLRNFCKMEGTGFILPLSTGQSVACNECQAFECALVYVLLKTLEQTCL
jgi:hypothetical protein